VHKTGVQRKRIAARSALPRVAPRRQSPSRRHAVTPSRRHAVTPSVAFHRQSRQPPCQRRQRSARQPRQLQLPMAPSSATSRPRTSRRYREFTVSM
jgi:hypothetical protein